MIKHYNSIRKVISSVHDNRDSRGTLKHGVT